MAKKKNQANSRRTSENQKTQDALDVGRKQANKILKIRKEALKLRSKALQSHITRLGVAGVAAVAVTKGILVAEGDSWFDYPMHDVLEMLEDRHGYDVESVAHKGDPIEEMAYGGGQLEELTRRIEKVLRRGNEPKAVLLSGGGNDIAGKEFGMLLNHAQSSIAGLNEQIVSGVIDERARTAYIAILSAVTEVCIQKLGKKIPILLHGYDYPVPDGRGFLGGLWILPGPWLEPGFREKGFGSIPRRIQLVAELIDRFNRMLINVTNLNAFSEHVRYIDLRNTLSHGKDYKKWWANELHPTEVGFARVTVQFVSALTSLP